MKKLLVIIWAGLCCATFVPAADEVTHAGLFPEDQYFILTLSERQLQDVETRRWVTLSKSQLTELRALAPSLSKRIGVASPFIEQIPDSRFSLWPDQVSGIWYCKNQVAIPRAVLGGAAGCREFNTKLNDSDAVLIGTDGTFGIGPRQVEVEKLIKSLDALAMKEPPWADFSIFILRPPVLCDEEEEQEVQLAIEVLAGLCEERSLTYHIGG